jgi:hypothetical protein
MRPASTSLVRNSMMWLAIASEVASAGALPPVLSGSWLSITATTFAGSIGIDWVPIRSETFVIRYGCRWGGRNDWLGVATSRGGVSDSSRLRKAGIRAHLMSCRPLKEGSFVLTSMMILSAIWRISGVAPTEAPGLRRGKRSGVSHRAAKSSARARGAHDAAVGENLGRLNDGKVELAALLVLRAYRQGGSRQPTALRLVVWIRGAPTFV